MDRNKPVTIQSKLELLFMKSKRIEGVTFNYGTAGFRANADQLRRVVTLCGLAAALRSFILKERVVSLCITASHNPESDNGVKMIDPEGEMLHEDFEPVVSDLVNSKKDHMEAIVEMFQQVTGNSVTDLVKDSPLKYCLVIIGRDTRQSSPLLCQLAVLAVEALGANVLKLGDVTTPQVHFITRLINDRFPDMQLNIIRTIPAHKDIHAHGFLMDYEDYLTEAVKKLLKCTGPEFGADSWKYIVDASNGVGGLHVSKLAPAFKALKVTLDYRNMKATEEAKLNDQCGAEYVQKERLLPAQIGSVFGDEPGTPGFSFDGDADRLILWRVPESGVTRVDIVDGDRQTAVIVTTFQHLIQQIIQSPEFGEVAQETRPVLSIGIVQTAYANGNSTKYISDICSQFNAKNSKGCEMRLLVAKTGVKHLHRQAEAHDIGIYFESNGHGTVIYNSDALEKWSNGLPDTLWSLLEAYLAIFNPTIGDAQADALAFLASLRILKMDLNGVYDMYRDLDVCHRQVPMTRTKLDTLKCSNETEGRLQDPVELQNAIDRIVSANPGSRGFVRASGTEDVCRVYAEGNTLESASDVCNLICDLLSKEVGSEGNSDGDGHTSPEGKRRKLE